MPETGGSSGAVCLLFFRESLFKVLSNMIAQLWPLSHAVEELVRQPV